MGTNGNDNDLVHKPLRYERSVHERLKKEARRRSYEQVAPVVRLALKKGLEVLEKQKI